MPSGAWTGETPPWSTNRFCGRWSEIHAPFESGTFPSSSRSIGRPTSIPRARTSIPSGRQRRSGCATIFAPLTLPSTYPVEALGTILTAEAATAFDELTRSGRDDELVRQVEHAWPNVFRQGQLIPAVEYLRANRIRTLVMREMETATREVDVWVAPSWIGNHLLLTNLTGHPAVVVPNGYVTTDGTPTSITFTGRLFEESEVLAVAHAYQEETGYHLERPPLD